MKNYYKSMLFFLATLTSICLIKLMVSSDVEWHLQWHEEETVEISSTLRSSSQAVEDDGDILTIEDVFFSVKTTGKNHDTRVKVIVDTWFKMAHNSVFFFTDIDADISLQV